MITVKQEMLFERPLLERQSNQAESRGCLLSPENICHIFRLTNLSNNICKIGDFGGKEITNQGDGEPRKSANSQPYSKENSNGCSNGRAPQVAGLASSQTNSVSGGSGGDGGDGDENKPFQRNIPSPKLGETEDEEGKNAVAMEICSDSIEPMQISDDMEPFFLNYKKNLDSADSSMPSAESPGQNYISEPGDVVLNGRKYDVRKILGQGAFGTCALVLDYEQDEILAMKQILKDYFNKEEIGIMCKLKDNPFIINLHGTQELPKHVRLFMEYAQGGDLHSFLHEHFEQLDYQSKFKLFEDIMEGVCFAHSNSIVHADIKSQNILLVSKNGGDYRAVLGDFGLSIDTTSPLYPTMKARGTIRYRSPELCRTSSYNTYSSDIWACGCVLMEIETGSPPWELAAERGEPSLIFTIGSAWKPPIPDTVLHLLRPIYEATLALEQKDRRTARDICRMLMSLVHEH